MKMSTVFIFVAGVVSGAVAANLVVKHSYEKKSKALNDEYRKIVPKCKVEEDPAEKEFPSEDIYYETQTRFYMDLTPKKDPYLITEEQFYEEHPEYTKEFWTYYDQDDTVLNEQDEIVCYQDYICEDGLTAQDEHDMTYVRNEKIWTDYAIKRTDVSYVDTMCQ